MKKMWGSGAGQSNKESLVADTKVASALMDNVSVLTCTSVLKALNRSSVSCKTDSEFPGMEKLASCSSPGPDSHCNT